MEEFMGLIFQANKSHCCESSLDSLHLQGLDQPHSANGSLQAAKPHGHRGTQTAHGDWVSVSPETSQFGKEGCFGKTYGPQRFI